MFAGRAFLLLVGAATAIFLAGVVVQASGPGYQDDFSSYYWGAKTWLGGGDPYDRAALAQTRGGPVTHPFVYPPAALWLFAPFAVLEEETARTLFLGLKVLALLALLAIWMRVLVRDTLGRIVLLVLCAHGFRRAMVVDLLAGNVSILEQLALWGGVAALLHGRVGMFSGAASAGAIFKLVPAVFLPLGWVVRRSRAAMLAAVGGAVAVVGVNVAASVASPGLGRGFLGAAGALDERGPSNPASLALIRDVASAIGWEDASWALYAGWIVAVCAIAVSVGRRVDPARAPERLIVLSLLAAALVLPRFKDYSYVALLVPAALVLRDALRTSPWLGAGLLILCCTQTARYQPLLAAAGLFALAAWQVQRGGAVEVVDQHEPRGNPVPTG